MSTLLGKRERPLFDSVNQEIQRLVSPPVILWKFAKYPANTTTASVSGYVDTLYGEPINFTKHYTPFKKISAYFERPTVNTESTDEGRLVTTESKIYVSRKSLEKRKVPTDQFGDWLSVGDILEFFKHGKEFYFEIKNVERDGFVNDTDVWTQYIAEVIHVTYFTPDRKLLGSR